MRRRWLTFFAVAVAIVVVAIVALPLWLPLLVKAVGPRYGATFQAYERIGYGRFALRGVTLQRPGINVTVDRVEMDTPVLWTWRHVVGRDAPAVAGAWTVEVQKTTTPPPQRPSGWMPLRTTLTHISAELNRWLPEARTGNGTVRWPGGELALGSAHWQRGQLDVTALQYRSLSTNVTVRFSRGDVIAVKAADAGDRAQLSLTSQGSAVSGNLAWWEQPATVTATFAEQGWMPVRADLRADDVHIPGERLKLGVAYHMVTGHVHATWDAEKISAAAVLHGEPVKEKQAPPLDVTLQVQGNRQSVTIETFHAAIPGGIADLTSPVTIDRTGDIHGNAARFSVRIDLSQLPWAHANGTMVGEARIVPDGRKAPAVEYDVTAENLALPGVAVRAGSADGRLQWPELEVRRFAVTGAAGETIGGHGTWNFREKKIGDAAMTGVIAFGTVRRWLPKGLSFDTVTVDARAAGALATLEHAGSVEMNGVRMAPIKPATGTLKWEGRGLDISQFSLAATVGEARITGGGAANAREVRLTEFTFAPNGPVALRLKAPARIAWQPALTVEDLHLAGPDAAVDATLEWGSSGRIEAALHGFLSQWVQAVMPLRGPAWSIPSFAVSGKWDHSPMTYAAAGELAFALPDNRRATINLSVKGTPAGTTIEALHGMESGNAVVNASGSLPLLLSPGHQPLVEIDPDGALKVEATTVPNAAFWQQLAAMTGVELRDPQVNAHLTGRWSRPVGTIDFRAAHVAMDPKRFARPLPTIDAVDVAISGDDGGLQLNRFSFTVEGQLVRASGRLPVNRSTWTELGHAPLAYLQRYSQVQLEVPDAQVAMFSRFLPAALAPAGRLQADIRFDRGTLGGYLRLRDAASRPLGPLGVLQQVNADVAFSDHRVVLRQVTATSGGQPITLSGSVELPSAGWMSGEFTEPNYNVTLTGQNLPFVRQSGLLMRGDLDLKLQTPAKGPPAISGKVVLRDSLFLTDVRSLLPHGGGSSPSRRPPYFSVDTPPLETWRLDIDVSGVRFMRVRTPVFTGVASAHFHLGGTLGEPRALGEATIDEGIVRMPFAAFQVKQGAVRLTEESPFEPTIYLRGAGRHYGYDLTMEVQGKASAPKINFTSSPALDAEQVLLMVMTGAAPANEVNTSLTHRAVQIGAFFGQSLVSSLTGGGVEPDRLSIESGEKISQQGKETYSIEYKLSDRWSITGEYDEFDEYNAGFKWRVAPRKKTNDAP